MKNYEEMAESVFRRIGEYETEKKKRKAAAVRTAAAICPAVLIMAAGVGIWKSGSGSPNGSEFTENIAATCPSDTASDEVLTDDMTAEVTENAAENATAAENDISSDDNAANDVKDDITDDDRAGAPFDPSKPRDDDETTETQGNETAETDKKDVLPDNTGAASASAEDVETAAPPNDGNGFLWCIFGSSIEYNGMTYHDNDMAKVSAYTRGDYIGKVSSFSGVYEDICNYRVNPDDSVYTVVGTSDVLLVVKDNGTVVVMTNSSWSLEKYEPERLDPNYIDPDDDGLIYY